MSSVEFTNAALPGSLFYKQETEQQEVKASLPKVVQEADTKLDGGRKSGFQALSLPIRKHQLGRKKPSALLFEPVHTTGICIAI